MYWNNPEISVGMYSLVHNIDSALESALLELSINSNGLVLIWLTADLN